MDHLSRWDKNNILNGALNSFENNNWMKKSTSFLFRWFFQIKKCTNDDSSRTSFADNDGICTFCVNVINTFESIIRRMYVLKNGPR